MSLMFMQPRHQVLDMRTFRSTLSTIFTTKTIPLVLGLATLASCSQGTDTAVSSNGNGNRAAANQVENSAVASSVSPPASNKSTVSANVGRPPNPSAAKQPTPHIGSGGDDLSLFTQVRGALSSDGELARSVIVEIKEGAVTLSGNLPSQAQKVKAESLVKNVTGVKSVRNNIRAAS